MEEQYFSETSMSICRWTRCNIPKDLIHQNKFTFLLYRMLQLALRHCYFVARYSWRFIIVTLLHVTAGAASLLLGHMIQLALHHCYFDTCNSWRCIIVTLSHVTAGAASLLL